MMNWFKKLMLFRQLILPIQFKKTDHNIKIAEFENKMLDHNKYVTIDYFNKFLGAIFEERLKQANLASKNDIALFLKKIYFDEKLRNNNDKVTSNKIKHVQAEKRLNDEITSDTKLMNDLLGKSK